LCMNRRDFIASSATAGTLLAANAFAPALARKRSKLRLGLIGTGMRGQVLLKELVRRDDVEVVALCDIEPIMLGRALAMIDKAGKAKPATYGDGGDVDAYRKMLAKGGLDGVIVA
ncbi:hypothetical protein JTP67_33580, partial [Streptomyces sp. S12]|nr:hypothetical protein [Streptomyces sp. S12]